MLGSGSIEDAFSNFEKKFKDKSGLNWAARGEKPKAKKYVFVERSYLADDDEPPAQSGASPDDDNDDSITYTPPKCTLAPPIQSLMELIFNQKHFANTMQALNYDVNKLPLGKLSKATITKGFEILKELSAMMSDASLAQNLDGYEELSNQYYSYIPHSFGRNRPPIIRTLDMLKPEIELLDSLSDLKNADEILKKAKETASQIHPLDSRFQGLGMREMLPLAHSSSEFSEIDQYLNKTCGSTHSVKYEVEDIFRIQRQGEFERFDKSKYATIASDRRLLWHGSRTTNFGGILSQGLRIAPPEAPVNGYMFGKVCCEDSNLTTFANQRNRVSLWLTCRAKAQITVLHTILTDMHFSFFARLNWASQCRLLPVPVIRQLRPPKRWVPSLPGVRVRPHPRLGRTPDAFIPLLPVQPWYVINPRLPCSSPADFR
jgi:poly [ADP-ribose] polymerase